MADVQCPALKTPVTWRRRRLPRVNRGGERFKAELRRLIVEGPQWHGKERGGMTAMARWHAGGATLGRLGDGEREEGERWCTACWARSAH
jgi:hypothetical protein